MKNEISLSGLRVIEDAFEKLSIEEKKKEIKRIRKIARVGNGAVLKTEGL